jgi:membrane protease YdiL (CAAX protease family)
MSPPAAIFGLLHVTSGTHVILACLLGFLGGWLYNWSRSLWSPIRAHLAIDLITGLLLSRTLQQRDDSTKSVFQGDCNAP